MWRYTYLSRYAHFDLENPCEGDTVAPSPYVVSCNLRLPQEVDGTLRESSVRFMYQPLDLVLCV